MALLELTDLTRRFGGLTAVDQISLNVERGERRALIGPNGAGKTTLFNLISGALTPTAGEIIFDGKEITLEPVAARARLGIGRTFQRNSLMPTMTVVENVRLAVQARMASGSRLFAPIRPQGKLQAATDTLVEEFRLTDRRATLAGNLAYGDQRRLEVAMALAMQPQLLLLDEPTAGMSMADAADFLAWAQALPRATTLLIIEHDMDVVFELADRITVLHYGQVIADGTPAQVRADPHVMEVYLGANASGGVEADQQGGVNHA